jgi:uncharacterized protein (DUF2345 family)
VYAANGAVKLFGQGSNTSITLDDLTDTVSVYALSNVVVSASNSFALTAKSNVDVYAANGAVKLFGQGSNTSITLDDVTDTVSVYALSNVVVSASNSFRLTATSNVDVYAANGSVKLFGQGSNTYVTLDDVTDTVSVYALSNVVVSASNNFALTAKSNIDVYAANGSVKIFGQGSNTSITLDDVTDTISLYGLSNVLVTASNNFALVAKSNVSMYAANGAVKMFGKGSNTSITLDDATNVLTVYGSNGIVVNSSNDVNVVARDDVLISANTGEIGLYANSNIELTADSSNMYITMDKTGDVVSIYSLSNVDIASGKVIALNATSNMSLGSSNISLASKSNIVSTACNNVVITACNDVLITGGNKVNLSAKSFEWAADSNINFYISGAPVNPQDPIFSINGTSVNVRGDLFITGSINTSNIINTSVVQESLKVSDKTIKLANVGNSLPGDSNPIDGTFTNDGAGIEVDGFPNPSVVTNSNNWPAHEKSILWRYGVNGTVDLGTSNVETESYWQVLGGGLRVTHRKEVAGALRDLSFTFRINQLEELELVKSFWNTNTSSYSYKRIAKFGRILA